MTPLVIAHRGGSQEAPEHTAVAYRRALSAGVDGFECDVRLTSDGHLVCLHDRRIDRTSDGSGRVSWLTLDELNRLDFGVPGARPDGDGPDRVLTLERLLGIARDSGRRLRLLIETKHPARFGAAVEQRLAALLRRHGLSGGDPDADLIVTVMSFSPFALRVMRAVAPSVPTAFLFGTTVPRTMGRDGRAPYRAPVLGPGVAAIRAWPELVERGHARGKLVYVWTVNEQPDLELALRLGVDAVITDRPTFVRAHIVLGHA